MSQLMSAVQNVQSVAQSFDKAWNDVSGIWDDSVAQTFHSTYISPLSSEMGLYISRANANARDIEQYQSEVQELAQQLDRI
ncbi:MAG: hypothetical protein MJZ84_00265 [Paludibacteraceae bacterium]|nr:hypothetical protein [Paludibacteraceae bacterium]